MYTDPDYRRMGIAKELLHRVIEEARNYGCGAVQITAEQVANGEALALLNEGQETAQWYQAGELAIPFLSTNAIESIASDTKTGDTSIYNLMGQKVQKVQVSGIYITGGRKVFIKK